MEKYTIKTLFQDDLENLTMDLTCWFNKLVSEKSGIVEDTEISLDQERTYLLDLRRRIERRELTSLLISTSDAESISDFDTKQPRSFVEHPRLP